MLSKMFTKYPLKLDTQTGQAGSPVYVNVQDLSADAQLVSEVIRGAGDQYPTYGYLKRGDPIASFSTFDLKEYFDAVGGVEELLIDSGGAGNGVDIFFQKHAHGSMRTAPSTEEHGRIRVGDGVLYSESLVMESGENAMLSGRIIATSSNGTTAPFSVDMTAALPSGVYPQADRLWTLGKTVFNATTVEGKTRNTINFGPQPVPRRRADSDPYPSIVVMDTYMPVITIETLHLDIIDTLTIEGAYYTAQQLVMYAMSRDEGSFYVADNQSNHIKFTLGKCIVIPGPITGDPAAITLTVIPWYTPGGSPTSQLAVNTAAQIS